MLHGAKALCRFTGGHCDQQDFEASVFQGARCLARESFRDVAVGDDGATTAQSQLRALIPKLRQQTGADQDGVASWPQRDVDNAHEPESKSAGLEVESSKADSDR